MTDQPTTLDLSGALPLSSYVLPLRIPGTERLSGWCIELAGPAHDLTITLNTLTAREAIEKEKAIEFAQVNNRKWKTEDETVADRRRRNVGRVCRRIVGWSTTTGAPGPTFKQISPDPIAFSLEAATDLFLRQELGGYFVQITDYLNGEAAFMPPSERI